MSPGYPKDGTACGNSQGKGGDSFLNRVWHIGKNQTKPWAFVAELIAEATNSGWWHRARKPTMQSSKAKGMGSLSSSYFLPVELNSAVARQMSGLTYLYHGWRKICKEQKHQPAVKPHVNIRIYQTQCFHLNIVIGFVIKTKCNRKFLCKFQEVLKRPKCILI